MSAMSAPDSWQTKCIAPIRYGKVVRRWAGHEGQSWECRAGVGVAGDDRASTFARYFDGMLTFDDPAVADEAILPFYSYFAQPMQGSNAIENRINWSFARLLTPTLAVTFDSGWIHQDWPIGHTSGFDTTDVGLKYEAYRNNQHETLVSVGVAWGIGHSGAQAVGADTPNTIQPGVFFGKGFGDLPDSLAAFCYHRSDCGRDPGWISRSKSARTQPNNGQLSIRSQPRR